MSQLATQSLSQDTGAKSAFPEEFLPEIRPEDSKVQNEIILKGQNKALELAVHGAQLSEILDVLATTFERQCRVRSFASILLLDEDGQHLLHGAAPNLPESYNKAIHGIRIGPSVGSCGTAAYSKRQVVVSDISADPLWVNFKDLAAVHGLAACWSTPIISQNVVLGTFAIYHTTTKEPSPQDLEAIDLLSRTASIIIERFREVEQRHKTEQTLQIADLNLAAFMKATSDVIYKMNADWSELRTLDGKDFLTNTGEPIRDWVQRYLPSDEQAHVKKTIEDAIRNKTVFQLEHRVLQADGGIGWTFSRAIPILDADGEITEWLGTASDVTERKRAETALMAARDSAEKQKRLYEAISRSTPDLIYVFNLRYEFIYANEALLTMWGRTLENSIGKRLLEIGYEQWHAEMHEREIDQVVATKQPVRGEVSFPHATLGHRIYDYILVPVINAEGTVEAVAGTTRDITDLKIAEQALKESEAKFRRFYDSDMVPIAFWNTSGKVYECNRAFAKLVGYSLEDIVKGRYDWLNGIAPEYRSVHQERVKLAVEGQVFVEPYEVELLHKGGNRVHVLMGYTMLEGSGDKGVAFIMDITIQKSMLAALELRVSERTKELNAANFSLKQSNDDLLQFAHVASHDLKEPVRKIRTFAGRLKDEEADKMSGKGQAHLQKVLVSASRMADMIDGVLAYSAISASEKKIEDVDLNAVLDDIRDDLEILINERKASVVNAHLPTISASRFLIHQLLYNLINNSLKFSRKDVAPHVSISYAMRDGNGTPMVELKVTDNGIGFDSQFADTIFNAFTRLNSKEQYEGTGLGLSLCKKIAERHHGRILAFGEKGKGATFIVSLPLHQ